MLSREDIRKVFDKFDTDGSGELSISESCKCITELGYDASNIDDFERFWKEADTNNDYSISFSEFLAWVRVGRTSGEVELMKRQVALINKMEAIKSTLSGLEKIQLDEGDIDSGKTEKIMDF